MNDLSSQKKAAIIIAVFLVLLSGILSNTFGKDKSFFYDEELNKYLNQNSG